MALENELRPSISQLRTAKIHTGQTALTVRISHREFEPTYAPAIPAIVSKYTSRMAFESPSFSTRRP
jgi:hypothetical protein